MQCKQACCTYSTVLSLSPFLCLSCSPCLTMLSLLSFLYMLRRSTTYTAVSLCSIHVYVRWVQTYARVSSCAVSWLLLTSPDVCMIHRCHHTSVLQIVYLWLMLSVVFGVCWCASFLQARVKNEILDYKDLAALPKVKAIYEVQQPDLISSSCQPYNRYTSDDRLDTYIYGEVFLLHILSFDDIIVLILHCSHFTGASFFMGLFLTNVCW